MRIHLEDLEHPTQPSRIRLAVFDQTGATSPVAGMPAQGFLVTEERAGTVKVVATLGAYATREDALARVRRRAEELARQNYRPVSPAA